VPHRDNFPCEHVGVELISVARPVPSRTLALILNWNQADLTYRSATAVGSQSAPVDVLVIDNGSTPEQLETLRHHAKGGAFVLEEVGSNLGFTGGMNRGIRRGLQAGYDFLWLVNNDAFPARDCLAGLLQQMALRPRLAAITPKLLRADGQEQHAGGIFSIATGQQALLDSDEVAVHQAPGRWISGTAMLLRAEAIREVGLLDEDYFAYWEDIDLCVRLRAKNWELAAHSGSTAVHLGSMTTGRRGQTFFFFIVRNEWWFIRKRANPAHRRKLYLHYLHRQLHKLLLHHADAARVQGSAEALAAVLLREVGRPSQSRSRLLAARLIAMAPWKAALLLGRLASLLPVPDEPELWA
jgi:GT2 family glycosyltransferase